MKLARKLFRFQQAEASAARRGIGLPCRDVKLRKHLDARIYRRSVTINNNELYDSSVKIKRYHALAQRYRNLSTDSFPDLPAFPLQS